MGVAHGRNIEEVSTLLNFYKKHDLTVGFPNKAFIPREFVMRYCNISVEKRHMLGASNVLELERCKNLARSVDTNLPFRAAISQCHIMSYRDSSSSKFIFERDRPAPRAEAYLRYLGRIIN